MPAQRVKLISLEEARAARARIDWKPTDIATAGIHRRARARQCPLAELVPFIDWSPFFHTWELRGRYPAILQHEKHGAQARELFDDAPETAATHCQREIADGARRLWVFPGQSVGDDVELYTDESRGKC